MTRRERSYMRRLAAMLGDPGRDDTAARRLAAVQVALMLRIDKSRRQINRTLREGIEAVEARRAGGSQTQGG